MGGAGNIVTSAVQAGFSWGAYAQDQSATYNEMQFNKKVNEHNARLSDNAADDAAARGDAAVGMVQSKGAQNEGASKTALASSGVDMASGTALDILAGTRAMTDFDAQMTRSNASREEWMLRNQSQEIRKQGELDERRAWNKTSQTFLSEMQRQGDYAKGGSAGATGGTNSDIGKTSSTTTSQVWGGDNSGTAILSDSSRFKKKEQGYDASWLDDANYGSYA